MDIKLKDKKLSLNLIIIILSVSIAFATGSGICIKKNLSDMHFYNEQTNYEFEDLCTNINDLMQYTDGFYGELREDSIEYEFNRIKANEGMMSLDNQTSMTDEEIKQYVNHNFYSYASEMRERIKYYINLEFYFEMDEGRKDFTNVDAASKEIFEEESLSKYEDYIFLKPDGSVRSSKSLEGAASYLSSIKGKINCKNDILIRIAKPLNEGDTIYQNYKIRRIWNTYGYASIVIFAAGLIGIVYSIFKLKGNKLSFVLENKIVKVLGKIDVEVKVLTLLLAVMSYKDIWMKIQGSLSHNEHFYLNVMLLILIIFANVYLCILDFLRIIYKYDEYRIRNLVLKESIFIKVIECILKSGVFISVLFILVNIAVWYISLAAFVCSGMQYYLDVDYSFATIFATVSTFFFDGITIKYLNSIKEIVQGIKKISEGNYNFSINVKGPKFLKKAAGNLEHIQDGLNDAVDKAVKSEKMKGELITNVSHDLKTPLTSIISYVDLLSQENITDEQRAKYLNVLKEKSNRLKVLIEDLFEVSKASSGSVELNIVNLDPVSLLRQTLGELEDKIEKSDLKIIKRFPEEKLVVYADGRKTFRVFQNLLSNIFKYSMDGSRVYIEVEDEEEFVKVTFKNTSKEELNFTEEEILQRFKRGDASRTTEGSGLGLAIAKSLTEVQGGKFDIKIDGDLFKAIVRLKKQI